jgi:hypothetical protein
MRESYEGVKRNFEDFCYFYDDVVVVVVVVLQHLSQKIEFHVPICYMILGNKKNKILLEK